MRVAVRTFELLDAGAVQDLTVFFVEFDGWCKEHDLHHGLDTLTLADFKIEAVGLNYPHFRGKGYACKVLSVSVLAY